MKNQLSFYFQKNNKMFGGSVLSICYKATLDEVKKYNLTNDNILIIMKNSQLDNLIIPK